MTTKIKSSNRPTHVRVFGRRYTIDYVPPSPLSNQNLGLCVNTGLGIYVEDCQHPLEETDTVLHEILHAIVFTTKMDLDPDLEEKIVATLSTGLIGVLQDNPEFAKWLIEDKNKVEST